MKAIILAAGQGTRLRPLTDDRPKAMVEFRGLPLVEHARRALGTAGVADLVVVTGYRAVTIEQLGVPTRYSERFASTNMVHSLFCAERDMEGGFLVVYGDIVFQPGIIRALLADLSPLAVAYNTQWRELWAKRMDDPLSDAETFQLDGQGYVTGLGQRPRSYAEVQGQYAGLVKVAASAVTDFKDFYAHLDRDAHYEGRPFDGLFMTALLQLLIDSGRRIKGVPFDGGWTEIDSLADLKASEALPEDYFADRVAHGAG